MQTRSTLVRAAGVALAFGIGAPGAVTTTAVSAPVLAISKMAAPDPVPAGSNITYTISYSNTGNQDATGVVITDAVPVYTTFVSATSGGTLSTGGVTWRFGALAAGASGSVQLVVQVDLPLANGTLIDNDTYSIDSSETAPTSGAGITTVVSAAELSISKVDAPDPVAAGADITYTISYSNTGSLDAVGVVITDAVPAHTTFVSATDGGTLAGGVVTWSIGVLNPGASGSVQLVVQVARPLRNGTIITNDTYSIDSVRTAPTSGEAVTTETGGQKGTKQVVFSGGGTGTFANAPTAFGFRIGCRGEAGNPYVGQCAGSVSIYALGIMRAVQGGVSEPEQGIYQMDVASRDGSGAVLCTLRNVAKATSGPTNSVDMECGTPAGSGSSPSAVVVVTGPPEGG